MVRVRGTNNGVYDATLYGTHAYNVFNGVRIRANSTGFLANTPPHYTNTYHIETNFSLFGTTDTTRISK